MTIRPALDGFADALDRLLRERDMRPAELARKLGVYSADVSRWRHGGGISIHNVRRIADLFGVSRADLEALAGYGPDSPATSRGQADPQLQNVIQRAAAELRDDLRTLSPDLWPTVLQAQRAARRSVIDIARMRADQLAADPAAAVAIAEPALAQSPRPRRPFGFAGLLPEPLEQSPKQRESFGLARPMSVLSLPNRPCRNLGISLVPRARRRRVFVCVRHTREAQRRRWSRA